MVQALRQEIIHAAGTGITRFYAGGALGFDTLAALTVHEMRKTMPQLELHTVIPFAGRTSAGPAEDRELYRYILERADHVEVLHQRYADGCYHERNRYMVDHSELCNRLPAPPLRREPFIPAAMRSGGLSGSQSGRRRGEETL